MITEQLNETQSQIQEKLKDCLKGLAKVAKKQVKDRFEKSLESFLQFIQSNQYFIEIQKEGVDFNFNGKMDFSKLIQSFMEEYQKVDKEICSIQKNKHVSELDQIKIQNRQLNTVIQNLESELDQIKIEVRELNTVNQSLELKLA